METGDLTSGEFSLSQSITGCGNRKSSASSVAFESTSEREDDGGDGDGGACIHFMPICCALFVPRPRSSNAFMGEGMMATVGKSSGATRVVVEISSPFISKVSSLGG